MTNFEESLARLSDETLRAIIRETRNSPPAGWDTHKIYDTKLSYAACLLLGRRKTWGFGPAA